jgi:hypothetical protein
MSLDSCFEREVPSVVAVLPELPTKWVEDRSVRGETYDDSTVGDRAQDPDTQTVSAGASALWVRWAAAGAIAVALIGGLTLYYTTKVCNQGLTSGGSVVEVCRKLQASDPPMVACGLVALVALTAFFSEITGFGVSLKREVRANTAKANTAPTKATAAEKNSDVAQDLALRRDTMRPEPTGLDADRDLRVRIESLVNNYNTIREHESSGNARTAHMTSVVTNMLSELSGVPFERFPLHEYLTDSANGGRRIAAYAYLYANPNASQAMALVQALLAEPTPFGQYWGLRALSRMVQRDPDCLDSNSRRQLEQLAKSIGRDTDRANELRRVMSLSAGA